MFKQIEEDREKYGKFWYRLLKGANFSDVWHRIANFWVEKRLDWMEGFPQFDVLVLLCHGGTSRMIQGYLKK